ncbi:hypothetical protein LEP1GSC062_4535 [Leptospira alexanderi serovar Manhao 3 str. L 60]|uniref:Uncharacterized protein n=1 Tax=Leptospira alexanderi serovar Manhao 3 str. L 60 TaxID=1049759 RepID=V6I8F6_9LEPT|nr:hypothetical protein LEP1GSC062_4535 [Leptospira alexanderi serovar Manhao 3 str. L 60]
MIDVFPVIIYFHRLLRIVIVPDKLKDGVQDPEFQVSLERERVKSKKARPF